MISTVKFFPDFQRYEPHKLFANIELIFLRRQNSDRDMAIPPPRQYKNFKHLWRNGREILLDTKSFSWCQQNHQITLGLESGEAFTERDNLRKFQYT